MKDKKRLLKLSEKIGGLSSKEGISLIVNIIKSVKEQKNTIKNNNEIKGKLLYYLYMAKENFDVFAGYNNAKYEMKKLLNNILCISKENGKMVMKNKDYDSLSFEEFEYVMSWARRVSISEKDMGSKKYNSKPSKL